MITGAEYVLNTSKKVDGTVQISTAEGKKEDITDANNSKVTITPENNMSLTIRKEDGTIADEGSRIPRKGDAFNISVADGCKTAWLNNKKVEMKTAAVKWQKLKYHGLNGGQIVKGEYICAPVSFIAEAFGLEYRCEEDGAVAYIYLEDGRELQFARGSIATVMEDEVRCMYCEALHRDGELLISIEWFARFIMKACASKCEDVVYVTDHYAELGVDMADVLRNLLHNEKETIILK